MDRHDVHFRSSGESGNIYWILGAAGAELMLQGRSDECEDFYAQVTASKSYEEALEAVRKWINLIDDDGRY